MNVRLKEIFKEYGFDENKYIGMRGISIGHINTTYTLYFDFGAKVKRYLLQEINVNVFKNPKELMENIDKVTTYANTLLKGFDVPNRHNKILRIFKTVNNETFIKTSDDRYFRIYHFTEGGVSYENSTDPNIYTSAGKAIGFFQNMLANFPIDELHETIKDFHNTPKRFNRFLEVLDKADNEVKDTCKDEIDFYLKHKDIAYSIEPLIESKQMPVRVTHNDTKINNIMFDVNTGEGLCLVDLDTVMPGSTCYDFGDFVRSGCNMGQEDSKDLSLVVFNKELFLAFAKGYITSLSGSIKEIELKNLTQGAILMCYECGMRFLTDYLEGNIYFKVQYKEHNLVRSRTQIRMIEQLLSQKDELDQEIMKIYNEL